MLLGGEWQDLGGEIRSPRRIRPGVFALERVLHTGNTRFARGADECVRPNVIPVAGICGDEISVFFNSSVLRMPEFDMQFYRRNLPHLQRDFKPHFITFVTKLRWVLPDWARDIALSSCCHDHRKRYELYVAVVMPDHVHLVLTPFIDERCKAIFSLIEIMRGIKGAAGREINQRMGRNGAVWQEESFDHVLRSSEGLDAKGIGERLAGVSVGLAAG